MVTGGAGEVSGHRSAQFGKPQAALDRRVEQVFQNRRHWLRRAIMSRVDRACKMRSVNTCPRSGSAASCTSSIAKIHLTADRHGFGCGNEKARIWRHNFSSSVISATSAGCALPNDRLARGHTPRAQAGAADRLPPDSMRSMARCVLPVLVGPRTTRK